jgi:NAD-dependent DNA ligase
MLDLTNLASNTEPELILWLKAQDDLYENDQPGVDDVVYDQVRRFSQASHPSNLYFTGVGADVRGGKVRLPHPMSGLQQVYEGQTSKWVEAAGLKKGTYTASDKADGTSSQITYGPDGRLQIAYSRGNGFEGADITRHISRISNIPKAIPATGNTVTVRAEIVIKKSMWPAFQKNFRQQSGEPYKNSRNAVSGKMNASENEPAIYDYLHCVAYTIMDSDLSKDEQFKLLRRMGFETVYYEPFFGHELNDDMLTAFLVARKEAVDFDIDGLVLDINPPAQRKAAAEAGQPTTVKFKVASADNVAETEVVAVDWNPSKDGYLKPRVQVKPVELCGVTVQYATAFNAKFILDNKIGPGAFVRLTRSGDVIPLILAVTRPMPLENISYDQSFRMWFEAQLDQFGEWEWSASQVDAILVDSDRRDVRINRLVDTFTKLRIDMLKAGNIEKLFDAGFITVEQIIKMTPRQLTQVLGENGQKVAESLKERLQNCYWPEFVGSLNLMGRGVGRKKLTSLYQAFTGNIERMKSVDAICNVEGFEEKTAIKIADSMDAVNEFLTAVQGHVSFATFAKPAAATGNKMKGQAVVFTGVRSEELEKKIVEQGGEIKSGISSSVTILVCKDPNSGSGKAKKAREMGIKIVDIREMEKMLFA